MVSVKHFLCFWGLLLLFPKLANAQDITIYSETPDAITLDVNVYDVKEKESVSAAIPYVYHAIFFRGFPDSIYSRDPLMGTDERVVDLYKDYFRNMENGRFSSFISAMTLVNYNKKTKPKMATVRITINKRALQNDLQQQGVKNKFGL